METYKLRVLLSYLFFATSLLSCGQYSFEAKSGNILGGRILPLSGIVFHQNSNSFITSAYAAPVCNSTVYARLHKLEADGTLGTTPLLSTGVTNGSYQFSDGLPADIMETFVNYQIVIDGCDEIFYRPVTGLNQNQDVTYTSTLVGHATQAQLNKSLVETSRAEVESLINQIGGSSILQAYNNLDTNLALTTKFQNIFSDPPAQLALSHPSVSVLNFPTMINEGLSSTFKVSALHFDPGYPIAYEWHLDGSEVGVLNQWVYSPSADSAGSYVVTVYVGNDNGSSRVDRTKPYYTLSRTITVLNTIPATPPSFTLASAFSNDGNVTLNINTGAGLSSCDSFDSFLITEDLTAPLPSNPAFIRNCSVNSSQNEIYSITGSQGNKTISLWVKDRNGIVSSVATTQTVVYDNINPLASLASPSGTYKGGSSLALSFSGSDGESGTVSLKVQYSADGSTYSDVATVATTATSYSWTLPTANTTTAYVRIVAIDSAGNSVNATSTAFMIDSTAPSTPSATLTSAAITNSTSATITVSSCADTSAVFISQSATAPNSGDSGWQTCSTSAGAITHTITGTDGAKSLYVWAKDAVGNVSTSSSVSVTLDQTNPVVAITSLAGGQFIAGASSEAITWSASDLNLGSTPVSIEASADGGSTWTLVSGNEANDGTLMWTVPSVDNSNYKIRISVTDIAGNMSTSSSASNFTVDSTPPSIANLDLGGGASTIPNNNVTVDLSGSDSTSFVTHFCLKYNNSTAPASADSCWTPLNNPSPGITPALSISFNGHYYLLGFAPGTYTVYGWLKDQAGNISSTPASDNIDYQPGTPPVITDVFATGTDAPASPPTNTDLSAPSGNDVFIKWSASDDQPLPATPVSLYYTTDDVNYTLLASNLPDAQGAGCTLGTTHSGCYRWIGGSPTNGYLKIRVAVEDSNSMVTFSSSTSMNVMPPIQFLAGNTDPGLGASATSAIFFNYSSHAEHSDPHSIAVAKDGRVYFRDYNRGLLMIDPSTGIQSLLIPYESTAAAGFGDGGPISGAKLKAPSRILLDYNDDLLILDYDRIRKVTTSTNPMTIETIIGGGGSTLDGVTPLNISIPPTGLTDSNGNYYLIPMPNGDIIFRVDTQSLTIGAGTRLRHYRAANNDVISITFSGVGCSGLPTQNLSNWKMRYFGTIVDPATSQIQMITARLFENVTNGSSCQGAFDSSGAALTSFPALYTGEKISAKNGVLYHFGRNSGTKRIYQYNATTNAWTSILGTGANGSCADGSLATSCAVDLLAADVAQNGQVYFVDRGRIRTIDSSGNVITLYGQALSYGDGGHPLSARFGTINSIDQLDDGRIVILDQLEGRFREFSIDGTVQTIAGNGQNGSPNNSTPAVNQSLVLNASGPYWDDFRVDPVTGDIYYNRGSYSISKLDRVTGIWTDVVGMGANFYPTADGQTGANVDLANYPPRVLGFTPTHLLAALQHYTYPDLSETYLKLYDHSDGTFTQSHLAGVTGVSPSDFCPNSTLLSACGVPNSYATNHTRAHYDDVGSRWLLMKYGSNAVRTMAPGGSMGTLVTFAGSATSFTYRRTGSTPAEVLYYCSSGRLRKHDLITDTALPWPISSMRCTGRALIYNSTRNSLIFPYIQNGLYGVAEYLNP